MRDDTSTGRHTILVATDFSAAASGALEHADALARETGAELRVVHAVVPGSGDVLEHDRGQAATAERLQGHVVSLLGADRWWRPWCERATPPR